MSTETQELLTICEQLPAARRAEVADFARFLLHRNEEPLQQSAGERAISHTEGIAGGDACVRRTRIPVWTLVQLKKVGRNESQLLADFPGLTQDDLDSVWEYYRNHTSEIEEAIAAEEREG